jgi:hypothetical protein
MNRHFRMDRPAGNVGDTNTSLASVSAPGVWRETKFHSSDGSVDGHAYSKGYRPVRTECRGAGVEPGPSDSSISPELRERVAMIAVFGFFGSVGAVVCICAVVLSSLIDWTGVAESIYALKLR